MTITFRYLTCDQLPELSAGESISTRVQTSLPWSNPSAKTSFKFEGSAENADFEKYAVLHQVDSEVDMIVDQEPVRRALVNRPFSAFYQRERRYLLVQAGRGDAHSALQRMALAERPITSSVEKVDLTQLMGLGTPTGAHFGNLRIADVKAASVWGTPEIVDSEEWNHYAELGELSAVHMRAAVEGAVDYRHIQLLRDRSVVIMKSVSERYDLQFVADLQVAIDTILAQ